MLGIYTNLRYAIRQYHNEDSIVFVVAKSAAGLSIRAWRVKFQKITAQKIQVHLGLGWGFVYGSYRLRQKISSVKVETKLLVQVPS